MADVEVWSVTMTGGAVASLNVRFKGTAERVIDRDTALAWLAGGHSLIVHSGPAYHAHRGVSVERIEVAEVHYLRTDGKSVAADHVEIAPAGH